MNKQNTCKLMLVSLILGLMIVSGFAQDGKMISEMARKADYDQSFAAKGVGITGKFTPAKAASGQPGNISNGILLGLLELDVVNQEYDQVKSGKFDLFMRKEKSGLRLYFEEKEQIALKLDVLDKTPENYAEPKNDDKSLLAFPMPLEDKSSLLTTPTLNFGFQPIFRRTVFCVKKKIYVKIYINRHAYWVWGGTTRCVDAR
jgi:hypothetical protein